MNKPEADYFLHTVESHYTYNFTWRGVPVIQYPQDLMAVAEIIHRTKPNLIIETGIAHGGSLLFYNDICDAEILGIDIDIRPHTTVNLSGHSRIYTILGSSIDPYVQQDVLDWANSANRILVILDSNHTEEHVLWELLFYSKLASNYIIVCDTCVEFIPKQERPWGKGNSPYTAVMKFLENDRHYVIDEDIPARIGITCHEHGYLRRVS